MTDLVKTLCDGVADLEREDPPGALWVFPVMKPGGDVVDFLVPRGLSEPEVREFVVNWCEKEGFL